MKSCKCVFLNKGQLGHFSAYIRIEWTIHDDIFLNFHRVVVLWFLYFTFFTSAHTFSLGSQTYTPDKLRRLENFHLELQFRYTKFLWFVMTASIASIKISCFVRWSFFFVVLDVFWLLCFCGGLPTHVKLLCHLIHLNCYNFFKKYVFPFPSSFQLSISSLGRSDTVCLPILKGFWLQTWSFLRRTSSCSR